MALIEISVSRPMPVTWRLLYHVELDAIVILDVFQKKGRLPGRRNGFACTNVRSRRAEG